MKCLIAVLAMLGAAFWLAAADSTDSQFETSSQTSLADDSAARLFDERIMPIFRSPDPGSCVQCHLSSVDLREYILPSHEQTFVALRDQGLIDTEHPEESKILKLIQMGADDPDEKARMIHEDMRNAEYEAFAGWIQASCREKRLVDLPPGDSEATVGPDLPDPMIRHARKDRIVDSFERNVWSQRMRCFPCHTPHEIGPQQKGALAKFEKWENEYGDRMRIFRESPAETIRYLAEASSNSETPDLPLLNLADPKLSLLIMKPTAKLPPKKEDGEFPAPTRTAPIYHMGGLKMHKDDQSYKSFVAWIDDYSKTRSGQYGSSEDLPPDNWHPTKRILRMRDTPESWSVGSIVQLFVFQRNTEGNNWSPNPIAFTQGAITPRHIANGALFLLAPRKASEQAPWIRQENRLPPGRYLVKVFVDSEQRIADDPKLMLGDAELQGQVEITEAQWAVGWPKAEWISGNDLQR